MPKIIWLLGEADARTENQIAPAHPQRHARMFLHHHARTHAWPETCLPVLSMHQHGSVSYPMRVEETVGMIVVVRALMVIHTLKAIIIMIINIKMI